jgi:CubicO group peptidase (beta-lactamase class C family)
MKPLPGPTRPSDAELRQLLAEHVKGLAIDESKIPDHVFRPQNTVGVFSDRGPEESKLQFVPHLPIVGGLPYHLNVSAFGAALHNALKDNVAGYTVQLRQQGQAIFTKEWQWAKRPQDGSETWTPGVQLHVASVSKLITAIAMTLLLSENNISPDAQIIDYLPDYWAKGPNIQFIAFRNLMNHTSGLSAVDVIDFQIMKAAIASGISLDRNAPSHLGQYSYQNLNFCLCRILLPVINGNISKSASFPLFFNDEIWDMVTVAGYVQYAQTKVFQPAGVSDSTLDHPASAGLAYKSSLDAAAGWNSGSLENVSGAAGWHLSVDDVLDVMGQFRRGGGILTPQAAQGMLDNGFGVDPFVIPPPDVPIPPGLLTPAGELYCKNGRWYDTTPNGREEQSLAYFLPDDIELVVLANSPVASLDGPEQFFRDVVTQVYLNNLTTQLSTHL